MKRTGISDLPLHGGKAPPWLFKRMVKLAGGVTEAIVLEYGQDEFLRRLSDPYWFQAFACVLAYDWHSSGATTVTTGTLKEGLKENDLGIAFAGGKGKTSRKTPSEILSLGEKFSLSTKQIEGMQYSSRMSAKVDNTAVQDGYQLYHHFFVFTEKGKWAVVQQGMNPENRYARRYHWLSENVSSFVEEPHTGIVCDSKGKDVLNMVSRLSEKARGISVDVAKDFPQHKALFSRQSLIQDFLIEKPRILHLPKHHPIINMGKWNIETLRKAYEIQPQNYEELISINGMGPKAIRALALVSQVIYGESPDWEDPTKFAFAHGGKDGYPEPVDLNRYSNSIEILDNAINQAKLGDNEKMAALRRLKDFIKT